MSIDLDKSESENYGCNNFTLDSALKSLRPDWLAEAIAIFEGRISRIPERQHLNACVARIKEVEQHFANASKVADFALQEIKQRNALPSKLCAKNHLRIMYDPHLAECPYCALLGMLEDLMKAGDLAVAQAEKADAEKSS